MKRIFKYSQTIIKGKLVNATDPIEKTDRQADRQTDRQKDRQTN